MIFEDNGPGIPNVEQAMQAGWSSGRSLGMGLPGAKRLMDEMEIQSEVGKGTIVTVRKWLRRVLRETTMEPPAPADVEIAHPSGGGAAGRAAKAMSLAARIARSRPSEEVGAGSAGTGLQPDQARARAAR